MAEKQQEDAPVGTSRRPMDTKRMRAGPTVAGKGMEIVRKSQPASLCHLE